VNSFVASIILAEIKAQMDIILDDQLKHALSVLKPELIISMVS
jgi:hypothetical protein